MKIKTLRFKNINSLKGIFKIDFDAPPLQHSGIFAIIGPTGAGKTTILDAICAALYSRTPRLPPGSCVELMTRHTGDCFAEVDFIINKGVFRSKWALRRARGKADGNLQPATMELSRLKGDTGTIIEDKKSKVPAGVEKLTGLDFSRFTRSILLAQGGFAAFLNASENERADLLEKMTGTRIYTLISTSVFERSKSEKLALEKLTIERDSMSLLSDGDYKTLLAGRQQASEKAGKIAAQLSDTERKINWLKSRLQLEQAIKGHKAKCIESVKAYSLRRNDVKALELTEKSLPLSGDFEVIKRMRTDRENCENQLAVLKNRIPEIEKKRSWFEMERISMDSEFKTFMLDLEKREKKIIQAEKLDERIRGEHKKFQEKRGGIDRLEKEKESLEKKKKGGSEKILQLLKDKQHLADYKKAHDKDVGLEGDLIVIRQHLTDVAEKDKELSRLQKDLKKKRNKQKICEKKLQGMESAAAEIEQVLTKEEKEKEALEKKAAALETERTLEQWEAEEKRLLEGKDALEQEASLDLEIEKNKKKQNGVETQRIENAQALEAADKACIQLEKLIEKEKAILEQLEALSRVELLVAKYESDRKKLVDGSPCPLCGSRRHPWKNKDSRIESKAEVALKHQKGKIIDLEKENGLSLEKKYDLEKIAARLTEKENALSNAIDALYEKRDGLAHFLKIDSPENKEQTQKQMLEYAGRLHTNALDQIHHIRKTRKDHLESANRLLTVKEEQNRLLIELEENRSQLQRLKDSSRQSEKEIKAVSSEKSKIRQRLDQVADKYGEAPVDEARWHDLKKQLEKRFDLFVSNAEDIEAIDKQYGVENKNLGVAATRLEECAKRLEQEKILADIIRAEVDRIKVKRFEIIEDKDLEKLRDFLKQQKIAKEKKLRHTEKQATSLEADLAADKRLFDAKTKEFSALSERVKKAEVRFLKSMVAAGFETIEAFEASLMGEMKRQEISRYKTRMTRQMAGARAKLKDSLVQLYKMDQHPETSDSQDELSEKRRAIKENQDAVNQELGAVSNQIQRQDALKEKYTDQLEKIQHQKKECHRWETLNSLIGSATGVLFQRFAQGLTLDHLLFVANQYLATLSNRYCLQRKKKEELGLEIVDTWQADAVRPTDTLSGGESFLVSLALALGLSALAGRDSSIDSLFLDEGFGALDPDTLEVALAALDNLNATGKTIGIISHVEALKERVPTQIQVMPVSGGVSSIKIV